MKYLKLKVLLEADKPCYCDFIVQGDNHLEELHRAILAAFEFEGKQMASFYEIDEDYEVIEEFPYAAIDPNYSGKLMKDIELSSLFNEMGDQLLYVYDYLNEWKFSVELIEENVEKPKQDCPLLVKSYGKKPKESDRDISGEDAEKILMNALLGDELDDDFDDEDWDSDNFDSLDDYEEYQ